MRKLSIALALLATSPLLTFGQGGKILPAQFGGWVGEKYTLSVEPLSAPLAAEVRASAPEAVDYVQGQNRIHVEVCKYGDPSAAYQMYTSQLHEGMLASFVGNNAAVDKDGLVLLSGNLVVRVGSQRLVSEADLHELIKSLPGHDDKTPLPDIRGFLPSAGLVQGTQRYSLGPEGYVAAAKALDRGAYAPLAGELSLGPKSDGDGEVMLAAYNNGRGGREVLLLVHYPTPQVAEQQLHHLKPLLESKQEFAGTTVERDASLLSLVLSPSSPEMAARLRKAIKYDTAVTWNEPSTTLTDPPWLLVLKTIFFAAFGFCVLAGVIGVLFGVFRLLMKRLFPGKIFDRSKSIELLQLGLNSKPVNPDDFY